MSKMGRYKSYLTGVQNEGGGQGHFWTMSKRKTLFYDGFPKIDFPLLVTSSEIFKKLSLHNNKNADSKGYH